MEDLDEESRKDRDFEFLMDCIEPELAEPIEEWDVELEFQ